MFDDLSIKIRNYKCFEEAGFDKICRVNLIIGKNNSGKSSLIDIIENCCKKIYIPERNKWKKNIQPYTVFSKKITRAELNGVFAHGYSDSYYGMHAEYADKITGSKVTFTRIVNNSNASELLNAELPHGVAGLPATSEKARDVAQCTNIPLEGKIFRRIRAERDIRPELDTSDYKIDPNGDGITNTIVGYLTESSKPRNLIREELLKGINEIFNPDDDFTEIFTRREKGNMEIYLKDNERGEVALSESGSGLKTVLSVLANIIIGPNLDKQQLSSYVFGFEELENNIHPALLRRLNNYIYKKSVEHEFIYFMTTHSSVMIDQFSKQPDAQIIHVTHKDGVSTAKTVETYVDNAHILDDLDIRASDVLQSNGIIWVEGPSDRIYINRWIDLWSGGELKEGTHYQCMYYGGRILSHFTADPLHGAKVPMLTTNRNAAVVIDSDKKSKKSHLNSTKKRIIKEFEDIKAFCWVTFGKEIENYIPVEVMNHLAGTTNATECPQYTSFFDHIEPLMPKGPKFEKKKPLLAEKICPVMTRANLQDVLDMEEQMTKLCATIRKWNS